MTRNKLFNTQICEVHVLGCIQVRSSLFACFNPGVFRKFLWSSFTEFDKESVVKKELKDPFFDKRVGFSLANFYDQMIFFSGGQLTESSEKFSEVFYYKTQTDEWIRAPAFNQVRFGHSSCFLGDTLYVYGGGSRGDSMFPMERLTNVSGTLDASSSSWEIIQINAERDFGFLMVPQNHSEKILIFRTGQDAFGNQSLNSFMVDPKKMTEEEKSSYAGFQDHFVIFKSN